MECKYFQKIVPNHEALYELIDTLWNVNLQTPTITAGTILELIDTLWNVNQYDFRPLSCL